MEDLPDLYELLDANENATEKELQKAFRKQAIKCHPDKNPTQQAAERFHLLTIAIERLTNASSRLEYDNLRLQKREAELRRQKLDHERKIWIEELERDERSAAQNELPGTKRKRHSESTEEEQLAADGARLRTELQAKRKLGESTPLMNDTVHERARPRSNATLKTSQDDETTVVVRYRGEIATLQEIKLIFEGYGSVRNAVLRATENKTKLALVEFSSAEAAHKVASLPPVELSSPDVTIRSVSLVHFQMATSSVISPVLSDPQVKVDAAAHEFHGNAALAQPLFEKSVLFRMKQRQRAKASGSR